MLCALQQAADSTWQLWTGDAAPPPKPSGQVSGPSQLTALAITTSSCGVSTPLPSTAPEAL